jgi:hypothetical protein
VAMVHKNLLACTHCVINRETPTAVVHMNSVTSTYSRYKVRKNYHLQRVTFPAWHTITDRFKGQAKKRKGCQSRLIVLQYQNPLVIRQLTGAFYTLLFYRSLV